MKLKFFGSAGLLVWLFSPASLHPCSRSTPVSNVEMIQRADVIVRAVAENYVVPSEKSNLVGTSMPESTIRFKVLEVILGEIPDEFVVLHGTLVDRDDFNDHSSPYSFVRPGGRNGNCVALSYRLKAQFILVLKKNGHGELTPYWYALGPVNEQLHSADDPWLLWVRKEADKKRKSS
jgi:hypothetical protein